MCTALEPMQTEHSGNPGIQPPVKRDRTIDAAKGLGMLLVFFGHVCHIHPFWAIIYSFHMPLFFLIAGINFRSDKYPSFSALFRKKLHTMLVPYLFFCLFGICSSLASKLITNTPSDQILDYLSQLPYAVVWMPYSKSAQLFNTPLWFVPCLTLLEFLFYWLDHIRKTGLFWMSVCTITFLGWWMESPGAPVDFSVHPWNFSTACFALIFFAIGNRAAGRLKKHLIGPKPVGKHALVLVSVFAAAFLITGYAGIHNPGSLGSRVLGNGFVYVLTGLTGSLCVLIFARFVSGSLSSISMEGIPLRSWVLRCRFSGSSQTCFGFFTHILLKRYLSMQKRPFGNVSECLL